MNDQNLIPTNQRSKNEARELSKKGGVASGKARRDKRDARERMKMLLELAMVDKNGKGVVSPITGKYMSVGEAIDTAVISKAVKGDIKAANVIYELVSQKIVRAEVTGADGSNLIPPPKMTDEQIMAEIELIKNIMSNK